MFLARVAENKTHRCNNFSGTSCTNKEIRREYLEDYVLTELANHIFNDKNTTHLADHLNWYNQKMVSTLNAKIMDCEKKLARIEKEQKK